MNRTKAPARAGLLRSVAFALLFACLFHLAGVVLEEKRYRDSMAAFYAEPRGSVEVLLLGSSRVHNGISSPRLLTRHGIRSNNFAQNGQVLSQTYFTLVEALRFQKPKVVVVDIYKVVQDSLINSRTAMHYTADFMRFGLPKVQMLRELLPPGERAEYWFDLIAYHTRWKDLTAADFAPPDVSGMGSEPLSGHYEPWEGWEVLPPEVKAPPMAIEIEYLDRIVDLCRAEGIELLLLSVPLTTPEDDELNRQAVLNGMADYAAEKGLPYLNMMHCAAEMGFDFRTDMADMYHVNEAGMDKVTDYLAEYLLSHYDLTVE